MNRYTGWGYPQPSRPPLSPYSSIGSEIMPSINDEDYTYITSDEIEGQPRSASIDSRFHDRLTERSASPSVPEDDILIVKHHGYTYPAHFPAFSISEGKVLVRDVQARVGELMELNPRTLWDIRLVYKGHNLKDAEDRVCDYAIKHNSEIFAVVREMSRPIMDDATVLNTASSEDIVVAPDDEMNDQRWRTWYKSRRRRSPSRRRHGDSTRNSLRDINPSPSLTSPRGSSTNLNFATVSMPNLSVPGISRDSETVLLPTTSGGPLEKLEAIATDFESKLVTRCNDFIADTPTDPRRLEDEHRKLTETLMQKVLLRLDEVETEGQEVARARRKELVNHTQEVLRYLDEAKAMVQ